MSGPLTFTCFSSHKSSGFHNDYLQLETTEQAKWKDPGEDFEVDWMVKKIISGYGDDQRAPSNILLNLRHVSSEWRAAFQYSSDVKAPQQ